MSSQVSTTDEALAALSKGLAVWSGETNQVISQSSAAINGTLSEISAAVSRCRQRVEALKDIVNSVPEDEDPGPALRELAKAEEQLQRAEQGESLARTVAERGRVLERNLRRTTMDVVPDALGDLRSGISSLEKYRDSSGGGISMGGGSGTGATPSSGVTSGSGGAGGGSSDPYASSDLSMIDISEVDMSDNPASTSDGHHGNSHADYRWMVDTWETTVRPGVDRGATRKDFADRDAARGAPPNRQTANVYDTFMGSDRIVVERRPDGTLNPTNGRHRIAMARSLGITHLPGSVR